MKEYYWIIILGVLAIVYVFLIIKQKRDQKSSVEKLNSYRVGDKVLTHIGIYGKIKRIYNTTYGKTCILEIGNTNKIDVEMDMRFIASLDEKTALPYDPKPEDKEAEKNEQKEEAMETVKDETDTSDEKQIQVDINVDKKTKNNKKDKNAKNKK